MAKDILENSYPKIEEGEHTFKILEVSERIPTAKSHYRKWKFIADEISVIINLFPWEAMSLLKALGYEEVKNKIEWDTDDVINQSFNAEIFYETADRGGEFAKLRNFSAVNKEATPFD